MLDSQTWTVNIALALATSSTYLDQGGNDVITLTRLTEDCSGLNVRHETGGQKRLQTSVMTGPDALLLAGQGIPLMQDGHIEVAVPKSAQPHKTSMSWVHYVSLNSFADMAASSQAK
ncbi:hypothetical protein NDU88_002742 [Pleurodeles waltl]|uniref:Uncharacterized protein n=1 Tax=Pleurodeles waltl TaxID=8319 RepID=A0AAV7QDS9_PLEWA|nr:hypothetical protein NDU88_002742 [Pleurodeles waltl]